MDGAAGDAAWQLPHAGGNGAFCGSSHSRESVRHDRSHKTALREPSCSHRLPICPWAKMLLLVLPCTDRFARGTFAVRREQVHPLRFVVVTAHRTHFSHQSTLVPFPLHVRYATCCWLSINLLHYETTLNSTGFG